MEQPSTLQKQVRSRLSLPISNLRSYLRQIKKEEHTKTDEVSLPAEIFYSQHTNNSIAASFAVRGKTCLSRQSHDVFNTESHLKKMKEKTCLSDSLQGVILQLRKGEPEEQTRDRIPSAALMSSKNENQLKNFFSNRFDEDDPVFNDNNNNISCKKKIINEQNNKGVKIDYKDMSLSDISDFSLGGNSEDSASNNDSDSSLSAATPTSDAESMIGFAKLRKPQLE